MSLDLTLVQLLRTRAKYEHLSKAVPMKALDPVVQLILTDYGAYFKEHSDLQAIDSAPFMTWFKAFRHPTGIKDEAFAVIGELMKRAMEPVPVAIEAGLNKRMVAAASAYELADILTRYQAGEEIDLRTAVEAVTENYDQQVDRKVKNPQVLDDIGDLLQAEKNEVGMHWRLPCLNRHMKPLQPGNFGILAARPDVGKTTMCASELTFMAAQVDALYPWTTEDERRSVLWFNNEGPGRNIVVRNFQAALNATTEDLVRLNEAGTIKADYAKALGGRGGTLRVFDIHGMWNHEVEDLMRLHKPAVVLFDMIDNIQFGGAAGNNGQRTDQLLEAMYQWARMMAVKYDCVVLATSQISADGDGLQWPTLSMLKDSKTGKQGAADFIITIGAVNDPSMANARYIGMTKNKRVRTGMSKSPQTEVVFDGDRGRYVEIQLT
jgi:replicative DNA helicase